MKVVYDEPQTWWRVEHGEINPVLAVAESGKTIHVILESAQRRVQAQHYHRTWASAKAALVKRLEASVDAASGMLRDAEIALRRARALKEPESSRA